MLQHLCPCCGRHCYLDELHCEKGVIFKETGVIPPRKPKLDENGNIKPIPEKKLKYLALSRDEKIIWNLQKIGESVLNGTADPDAAELVACLREEDRADFLLLLEKVGHGLHHKK